MKTRTMKTIPWAKEESRLGGNGDVAIYDYDRAVQLAVQEAM